MNGLGLSQKIFERKHSVPKMTEPKSETPVLLSQARTDKFTAVTNAGNKAATALAKIDQNYASLVADAIKKFMPEYLQIAVSVVFEKTKLWKVIESDKNLAYFANMDYDSWCNPGDLNKSELEKAKVIRVFSIHKVIKIS